MYNDIKSKNLKKKNYELDIIKILKFSSLKDTSKKMKMQAMDC